MNGLGLKEAKARFEAEFLAAALKRYRGNVQLAAKALKTSRSVVYHLIQKYEIRQTSVPPNRKNCPSRFCYRRLMTANVPGSAPILRGGKLPI